MGTIILTNETDKLFQIPIRRRDGNISYIEIPRKAFNFEIRLVDEEISVLRQTIEWHLRTNQIIEGKQNKSKAQNIAEAVEEKEIATRAAIMKKEENNINEVFDANNVGVESIEIEKLSADEMDKTKKGKK